MGCCKSVELDKMRDYVSRVTGKESNSNSSDRYVDQNKQTNVETNKVVLEMEEPNIEEEDVAVKIDIEEEDVAVKIEEEDVAVKIDIEEVAVKIDIEEEVAVKIDIEEDFELV
jgi:hypothetical protein